MFSAEHVALDKRWRGAIRRAKRAHWRSSMHDLNVSDPSTRRLFGLVRSLSKGRRGALVSDEELARFWSAIWAKRELPNEEAVKEKCEQLLELARIAGVSAQGGELAAPFTMEEVKRSAVTLARGKAPDHSGFDNELLSFLPDEAYALLAEVINMLRGGVLEAGLSYPACWRKGRIVFLPKDTSSVEAMNQAGNYRPISLLSSFFKLTERVLWERIRPWAESHGLYHHSQAGFRVGRSTVAQTFPLHILRQWCEEKRRTVFVALLDVAKAFDSVSHIGVLSRLLEAGMPEDMAALVHDLLGNHVNYVGEAPVHLGRGAPQGSILGPFDFISYFTLPQVLDEVATEQKFTPLPYPFPYRIPAFADDTALLAIIAREMQVLLDESVTWGKEKDLTFNAKKSAILCMGARHIPDGVSFTLGGVPVPIVEYATHLGITLKAHVRVRLPEEESAKLEEWFSQKLNALSSLMLSRRYGLSARLSLHIVKSVIVPKLLYGAEIVRPKEREQVMVNRALRVVVGAYGRTHVSYLHFYCGMWRVSALACFRRFVAVASWHVFPESAMALKAFQLAVQEKLDFFMFFRDDLRVYRLSEAWAAFSEKAASPEQKERRAALRTWKAQVRASIGESESAWNRAQLKAPCNLPQVVHPHPCLDHPLSNFGFMLLSDAFDPPDKQTADEKTGPCHLCGEEDGDRFSHLLFSCSAESVVVVREMYRVVLPMARLETFVNLVAPLAAKTARTGGRPQRGAATEGVAIVPKKKTELLKLLRAMYKLRKRARNASL